MRWSLLLLGLFAAAAAGCGSGPRPVPMRGEVTFDGAPVGEGTITLSPAPGHTGAGTGGTIVDGRFEIPGDVGPVTGTAYRVEIHGYAKLGKMVPDPFNPSGPKLPYKEDYIPARYGLKSTLVVEVPAGARDFTHDFRLEKGEK